MTPYIMLGIGIIMLSALLTYAMWVRVRVWILREDLFEIRDRLWDQAVAGGFLDDPEYRTARDALNTVIRIVPLLSYHTWTFLNERAHGAEYVKGRIEVEAAVTDAYLQIMRYIYRRTLTGFIMSYHQSLSAKMNAAAAQAFRIIRSREITELDTVYKQSGMPCPA